MKKKRKYSRKKKIIFAVLSVMLGLLLGLALTEVILQVFDPLPLRLAGDKINLRPGKKFKYTNKINSSIDPEIFHIRNSLGLRGEDPPVDFNNKLSLITIGGSTTECYFLTEGKTWPDLLGKNLSSEFEDIWINNAGMDGHTTYGNLVMLRDHVTRIRPKVVLFLIGVNDVGTLEWSPKDENLYLDKRKPYGIISRLANHVKIFALLDNYLRARKAEKYKLLHFDMVNHGEFNFKEAKQLIFDKETFDKELNKHKKKFLYPYELRVKALVEIAQAYDILPVLITQPAVFGEGKDPVSKIDFAKLDVGGVSGKHKWQLLEVYNDVTRKVAKEYNIPLVDLAAKMPKSSKYFYDFYHFNNAGAEKVAEILAANLDPILKNNFPDKVKK